MFKKRNQITKSISNSFDNIFMYQMKNSELLDDQFFELSDKLLIGRAIMVGFEEINLELEANRAVAFLSGVVYALSGEVIKIKNETYLFAPAKALEDGSIRQYLNLEKYVK